MASHFSAANTLGRSLIRRKSSHEAEDARVDMTAMVDLVFMMNIFFLVTTLVTAMAEIDLPAAKHVVAANIDEATVFTIVQDAGQTQVFLGDGDKGTPLADAGQDAAVADAVDAGIRQGHTQVIIKAEREVPARRVARVASAATSNGGVELFVGVMEMD